MLSWMALGAGGLYLLSGLIYLKQIPKHKEFKLRKLPKNMYLPVLIGYTRYRKIWLDVIRAPHIIVAGETGGGKSSFLHQAIIQLVQRAKVLIIDLKRVEFQYMKNHAWYEYTLTGTVRMLEWLTKEYYRRRDLLAETNCNNVQKYNKKFPKVRLNHICLVVDELSQLVPADEPDKDIKKIKAYCLRMLMDLSALARCVGIHLILATQRPDKDVLPGLLKANIPVKICYPVTTDINSRIVLDSPEAAEISAPGRAIFKRAKKLIQVQTAYLDLDRAEELIQKISVRPLNPLANSPRKKVSKKLANDLKKDVQKKV